MNKKLKYALCIVITGLILLSGCSQNKLLVSRDQPSIESYDGFVFAAERKSNCSFVLFDLKGNIRADDSNWKEKMVFRTISGFEDGLAVVYKFHSFQYTEDANVEEQLNQAYCIDTSGNPAFQERYFSIHIDTGNDMLIVQKAVDVVGWKNYKLVQGYLDYNGKPILPLVYDQVTPFWEGNACVKQNGIWYIIDKTGKHLVTLSGVAEAGPIHDGIFSFTTTEDTFDVIRKYGYMDLKGKTIVKEKYYRVNDYSEGLGVGYIEENDKNVAVIFDIKGNIKYKKDGCIFESFINNKAIAGYQGKVGIVDQFGKWIIKPNYYDIDYSNGMYWAKKSENDPHTVFMDGDLSYIKELDYPCTEFHDGYSFYVNSGTIYAMDSNFNTVMTVPDGYIPMLADAIWSK